MCYYGHSDVQSKPDFYHGSVRVYASFMIMLWGEYD